MQSPSLAATRDQSALERPKQSAIPATDSAQQWIFTDTELASTPSIVDGMPAQTERDLRTKGLNFILQVGIMLKIQQLTLYTAGVFFNRFLMRHSLQKTATNPKPLHHYQIAATALLLATKTDETIRRTKDIILACCRVAQKNPNLVIDEQNKDYWKWRDTLLFNEDILLESLCFDLTVESPYKLLYEMLRKLGVETNKVLRNSAWAFLCDSLLTTLCLLQSSRTIAASALWCGARHSKTLLPGDTANPHNAQNGNTDGDEVTPWWDVVHVRLRDVKKACNYMAELYETRPRTGDEKQQSQSTQTQTPPSTQSQPQNSELSQSQQPSIYIGLRSDLSGDEEEDGEVVDGADASNAAAAPAVAAATRTGAAETNGSGGSANPNGSPRGVKRARALDDMGDRAAAEG